jgi:hypothetical protein
LSRFTIWFFRLFLYRVSHEDSSHVLTLKWMLGINFKNINLPFTHEWCIDILLYINSYPTWTINPKMWEPLVHIILRNFPPLFTKYICIMGYMMITQHNALWDDASIHCDFNTLQSKMKIIIATYNIYC